jgi:hypothetical protein
MPSNYTGIASYHGTISMPDDGDPKKITPIRAVLERLLDNDVAGNGNLVAITSRTAIREAIYTRRLAQDGLTVVDTDLSMAAVQRVAGAPVVACKTGRAFGIGDTSRLTQRGVVASISSLVTDAASSSSRILVIGTGGNRCSYSDDDGANWSAGGDLGATPTRLVWNSVKSKFIATVGTGIKYGTNGTSWSSGTTPSTEAAAGLAVATNGNTFGINSLFSFRKSTDGGATWTTVVGAPPSVGTLDDSGSLAGMPGFSTFHAGRHSSGASLIVSKNADGTGTGVWTTVATFTPPSGTTFNARPRIMLCPHYGLVVVVAPLSDGSAAIYGAFPETLDGDAWHGIIVPDNPGVNAFAVAGGRLFYTANAEFFGGDGFGTDY